MAVAVAGGGTSEELLLSAGSTSFSSCLDGGDLASGDGGGELGDEILLVVVALRGKLLASVSHRCKGHCEVPESGARTVKPKAAHCCSSAPA